MSNSVDDNKKVIAPEATIGILGNGQLGRMMAIAAKQMGYRVHVYSPTQDSPGGQVADQEWLSDYLDIDCVERFAREVDVVTLEFENIPIETLEIAMLHAPVFPGIKALCTAQHRSREKQFLRDHGIPTCEFDIVHSLPELIATCEKLLPAVIKTTSEGYDGKGQVVVRNLSELEEAWHSLKTEEAIVEEFIDYDFEFSVVAARNSQGEFSAYPTIRNEHRDQILDVSYSPSGLDSDIDLQAIEIAKKIMESLDAVGVMCVEFFFRDGEILVNEIAPRPHNSGHLTIEGHVTNQFEQHVRAICGLSLGSVKQSTPVAMANLLGDVWAQGEPLWDQALSVPNVKLHLYGKDAAKPKRKMGHLTALGDSTSQAVEQVVAARERLCARGADLADSNSVKNSSEVSQ